MVRYAFPHLVGGLGGQALADGVLGHATFGGRSGDPQAFRRGNDHHHVEALLEPVLDEEGHRVDHHAVCVPKGRDRLRQEPRHLRMGDRLEPAAGLGVAEHPAGQPSPIELAGGSDRLRTERCQDLGVSRRSGVHRLPGEVVGVDHHGTPVGQHPGHGGLAGSDPSGQPNEQHRAAG